MDQPGLLDSLAIEILAGIILVILAGIASKIFFGGQLKQLREEIADLKRMQSTPASLPSSSSALVKMQCAVFSDDSAAPKHTATHTLEVGKPTPIMLNWKEHIHSGHVTYRVPRPYELTSSLASPYDGIPPQIDPPQEMGATIYAFKILNDLSLQLGVTVGIPQVSERDDITILHPRDRDHA